MLSRPPDCSKILFYIRLLHNSLRTKQKTPGLSIQGPLSWVSMYVYLGTVSSDPECLQLAIITKCNGCGNRSANYRPIGWHQTMSLFAQLRY